MISLVICCPCSTMKATPNAMPSAAIMEAPKPPARREAALRTPSSSAQRETISTEKVVPPPPSSAPLTPTPLVVVTFGHGEHSAEPSSTANVPGGHATHTSELVARVTPLAVPFGQRVQCAAPVSLL